MRAKRVTCQRRGHGFNFKFAAQAGLQLESLDSEVPPGRSGGEREREREKEREFDFYQETMSMTGASGLLGT